MLHDRKIITGVGTVLGIRVKQRTPQDLSGLVMSKRQGINLCHGAIGLPAETTVRATAALLGVTLTGSFAKCESCAIAKIRQKIVSKSVVLKTEAWRVDLLRHLYQDRESWGIEIPASIHG